MPNRVQRTRTKGGGMPEGAVYVGRGSKWGNPYKIGDDCPNAATAKLYFEVGLDKAPDDYKVEFLEPLRGKDLACWCSLDQPCHADVLLELANPTDVS